MPVRMSVKDDTIGETWITFHETHGSITKCEEELFINTSLTLQQYYVMSAIKSMPDPVTLTGVADWLDRNPNSITLIIDRMEKAGLVKRMRDLKDRRAIRLVITEKGEKELQQASDPYRELGNKILSTLSDAELDAFAGILKKIREATYEHRNIKDKVLNKTLPPPPD